MIVFIGLFSNDSCEQAYGTEALVIGLLVESLLFGAFTLCILGDQSSLMSTNEAKIDRLKSLQQQTGLTEQGYLLTRSKKKNLSNHNNHTHNHNHNSGNSWFSYPICCETQSSHFNETKDSVDGSNDDDSDCPEVIEINEVSHFRLINLFVC